MKLHIAGLEMKIAICSGTLCDRQEIPTDKKNCACLHMSTRSFPLVLGMRLFVKDDKTTLFKVPHFRSWAFTTLCVGNIGVSVKHTAFGTYENELRASVKTIVDKINSEGGWSMFGWLRVGTEADSSVANGEQGQQIGAMSANPHVVKLIPSYTKFENLEKMKFKIPVTLG